MAKIQITGGGFQDSEGNVLANGYLEMTLSQDCQVTATAQICSGITVKVPLDSSGNVSGTVLVWPNDQLSPSNNFYTVRAFAANGQLAWGPNVQQILGTGPFNLNTWVPNQLVVWIPSTGGSGSGVALQTNGATNSSQSKLNLVAGDASTITDSGSGNIVFSGQSENVPLTVGIANPVSGLTFTGPTERQRPIEILPTKLTRFVDDFNVDLGFYSTPNLGGAGTITWNGDGTLSVASPSTTAFDQYFVGAASPVAPWYTTILKVITPVPTTGAYNVLSTGIYKDGNNFCQAEWDLTAGQIRIALRATGYNSGNVNFLGTVSGQTAPTSNFQFAFVITRNAAQAWVNLGFGWKFVTSTDASVATQFMDPAVLSLYNAQFNLSSSANNGTWKLDGFSHGYFGQLGVRDPNIVTHKTGEPYFDRDGYMYFTATSTAISGDAQIGVYRLAFKRGIIERVGSIFVNRNNTASPFQPLVYNDLPAHLVYDGDLNQWRIFISSFANGFGGDIYIEYALFAGDILNSVTVLSNMTKLANITQYALGGGHGVYDASVMYDKATSRWYIGYAATPNTNFPSSPMYAALDYTTDFVSFTNVLADTGNTGFEGVKLQRVGGNLYVFAGGFTVYRVYNSAGTFLGNLNCPNPSTGNAPAHPMIFPVMDGLITKWKVMTFDDKKFGSSNFTWGSILLYDASQTETGFEFSFLPR